MSIQVPIPGGPVLDDSQATTNQVPVPGGEVWLDEDPTGAGGGGAAFVPKILIF